MRLFQTELMLYDRTWNNWRVKSLDTQHGLNCCGYKTSQGMFITTGYSSEVFLSKDCERWQKFTSGYGNGSRIYRMDKNCIYALGVQNGEYNSIYSIELVKQATTHKIVECNFILIKTLSGYVIEDIICGNIFSGDVDIAVGNNTGSTRKGYVFEHIRNDSLSKWTPKLVDMPSHSPLGDAWSGICSTPEYIYDTAICGASYSACVAKRTFGGDYEVTEYDITEENIGTNKFAYRIIWFPDVYGYVMVGFDGYVALNINNNLTISRVGTRTFEDVTYVNGKVYAVNIDGEITETSDGINWSNLVNTGIGGRVNGISYGNGKLLIVSDNGKIAYKKIL